LWPCCWSGSHCHANECRPQIAQCLTLSRSPCLKSAGKKTPQTSSHRTAALESRERPWSKPASPNSLIPARINYINAIPDAKRRPWNICPSADCNSNNPCAHSPTNDYRAVCWLYHPICNCPSLKDIRVQARIERLAEEILEGPGNGSRNEAEDQPSSCTIWGDEQSCQTSNGRWSSTQ
jgi:hypothetical protein